MRTRQASAKLIGTLAYFRRNAATSSTFSSNRNLATSAIREKALRVVIRPSLRAANLVVHWNEMNWGFLGAALSRAVFSSAAKKRSKPPQSQPQPHRDSVLSYTENGRSGHVRYSSGGTQFSMYFEFGGGNALITIWVPSPNDWESKTGLPQAKRDDLLHQIARQLIADKTSTGQNRYEIGDNSITIFDL